MESNSEIAAKYTLFDQKRAFDIYMNNRFKEWKEEGREEGRAEGRTEGKVEGRLSAFRDIREKLAQSGMSPAMIDSVLAGL